MLVRLDENLLISWNVKKKGLKLKTKFLIRAAMISVKLYFCYVFTKDLQQSYEFEVKLRLRSCAIKICFYRTGAEFIER